MKEKPPTCRKCGGYCYPSKALQNETLLGEPNELGYRTIYQNAGEARLKSVLKCEGCGHSFRPGSGAQKGENRGQGRKPTDPIEGRRVKWALTFKPSHFEGMKKMSEGKGISKVRVVENALDLLFESEGK